jgi:molecular chaperone DnaJ
LPASTTRTGNDGDAGSERTFKDVSEAYSVLSDPEERKQYDAIRAMGGGARFTAGGGGWRRGRRRGFEDIFGNLFGQGAGSRQRTGTGYGDLPPEFADLVRRGSRGFGGGFSAPPGAAPTAPPAPPSPSQARSRAQRSGCANRPVKVIDVRIPPGIKDGQKVRVRGAASRGRPAAATSWSP